ncbi:hypothetical protein M9H77_28662 [Catharanthus roseus]|uniref:Uncharacterized protein n=1 Tax=Catharanthus roseus TaxID=4058 RepID=A0ACC0AGX8_CATRO|nr:hypothetical protein M9H77_28662 [Catharanthus roseus]
MGDYSSLPQSFCPAYVTRWEDSKLHMGRLIVYLLALELLLSCSCCCLCCLFFYNGLNQTATNFYSFEQGRIAAYRFFEMIRRSSSRGEHPCFCARKHRVSKCIF